MSKVMRSLQPERAGLPRSRRPRRRPGREQSAVMALAAHRLGRQAPAVDLHHAEAAREARARRACSRSGAGSGRSPAAHRPTARWSRRARTRGTRARPGGEQVTSTPGSASAISARQPLLVRGVGIGVEQADRDRVDSRRPASAGISSSRTFASSSGSLDRAVGAEPLGDLEAVLAAHRRRGLGVEQVVDVAPVVALHEQQVAEAARGDEGDARALALQHRVGGDGRAVAEVLDPCRCRCPMPSAPRTRRRPATAACSAPW